MTRISVLIQKGPKVHSFLYDEYRVSISGVKRPGLDTYQQPFSSAEIEIGERGVEL
jgi:hypothetical protein